MGDLKYIGACCKTLRYRLHLTQKQMGDKIGYSPQSISAFECGRLNNALILLHYMDLGLPYSVITKGGFDNGDETKSRYYRTINKRHNENNT